MTRNKGMDPPARLWAPTGARALRAFLVPARRHCTNIFKAPPTSDTQILTPEWSSRIIHEVSVRFLCTRKSTGLQDGLWGLKQTNSVSKRVSPHWERDFQQEPKGLTDMDTLALGQQGQHIPCVHSSHSWPSPWLWVSTVKCQNQQSCLQFPSSPGHSTQAF